MKYESRSEFGMSAIGEISKIMMKSVRPQYLGFIAHSNYCAILFSNCILPLCDLTEHYGKNSAPKYL